MKNALTNIKTSIAGFGSRTNLMIQKNSPEICLGLGLVGFVGTVVLACRATLKSEEILDRHAGRMELAKQANEVATPEDEFDYTREKTVIMAHTVVDFAKLYAPTMALGAVSAGLLIKSHNILSNRYTGAVMAFNAVTEAFKSYRDRVIEDQGENKDFEYRYGVKKEKIDTPYIDDKGKEKTKKEEVEVMNNPVTSSDLARYFDSDNDNWDENPQFNLMFLRGIQSQMTDKLLNSKSGCLFLNDVYDALGFDPTPVGQIVGWVVGEGNNNKVDFGLDKWTDRDIRRFINGRENVVLLDFNVDGVVWDKIRNKK